MQDWNRRAFLKTILVSAVAGASSAEMLEAGEPTDLGEILQGVRENGKLPGLAAAVMLEGSISASGAVGVRRIGDDARLTRDDKFHTGSCTKAMTATLAAIFVDRGWLSWSTTLADIFRERSSRMHHLFRAATLEHLLTHRSGAPENGGNYGKEKAPVTEQRLTYMEDVTRKCPLTSPGSHFRYSNAGYIIAGAMLERIGQAPWEELMRREIFRPLGMTSAGFGPPCAAVSNDQPWGHIWRDGKFEPRYGDNPPALGPAGTVHCTLADYLKFADLHTSLGAKSPGLVRPEQLTRMHTATAGAEYGMGWGICQRTWARGLALNHHGSNTMNFFSAWLAPKLGLSIAVASNCAGGAVPDRMEDVCSALVRRFAPV